MDTCNTFVPIHLLNVAASAATAAYASAADDDDYDDYWLTYKK